MASDGDLDQPITDRSTGTTGMDEGPSLAELLRLEAVANTGLTNQPDATMERLAAFVTRLLGAKIGLVSLVDDVRQFFPGQSGLDRPWDDERQTPLSHSLCKLVVETGEMVQIDAAGANEALAHHAAHTVLGVESYLGAPLVDADGRILGSLCAIETHERRWTSEERQILSDLAFGASSELRARIAVSLANEARAAAEQAGERVQLMADVSTALISVMDPERAIRRMLDILVDRFASWAIVFMRADDENAARMLVRHHRRDLDDLLTDLAENSGLRLQQMQRVRAVFEGTSPAMNLSAAEARGATHVAESTDLGEILRELGLGPTIVVPIRRTNRTLGVMALIGHPDRADYDDIDLTLAGDLARRAAMAFDHARIHAREKRIAFELQHALLPELPEIEGINSGAVYRPAAQDVEVGGDWYDLIDRPDGSVILTIGDVTGHNISAAAAMGRVQVALRAVALSGAPPAEILDRVATIAPGFLGDLFATCAIVGMRRDAEGWTMEIANAGHLPPLVLSRNGVATFVPVCNDPLLGTTGTHRAPRTTNAMPIAPGDTVILYTDGLIEQRREGIDAALERLRLAAERLPADLAIDDLCPRLVELLEPDGRDDVAVIAVRPL
ncbi:MAG: SpoIIE family protein phosphatase [Ilumatobacteraceae bacterium]